MDGHLRNIGPQCAWLVYFFPFKEPVTKAGAFGGYRGSIEEEVPRRIGSCTLCNCHCASLWSINEAPHVNFRHADSVDVQIRG